MANRIPILAIIAAYNEEDVVGQVVGHLIDEGVSVYFIDNGSTDRTIEEVERYRGRGLIEIERYPADGQSGGPTIFEWTDLLKRKEMIAREIQADWFIHHDSDEFRECPWSGATLRSAIAQVDTAGYNAIDFHVLNFWPTNGDLEPGADVRKKLQFYEPAGPEDRLQIKCWKNLGQTVDLASSGGHEAAFDNRRVFPVRFLVRHYPIRGQAHGERKVLRERLPRFDPAERARGWHVQYTEGMSEHTRFVRRADELVRYDPDAVRLSLLVRNRNVEELTDALQASQEQVRATRADLEGLRPIVADHHAELDAVRQHLATQDDELGRLRPAVLAQHAQLEEIRHHLLVQDSELERLRPLVSAQQAQIVEAHDREETGRRELEHTKSTLEEQMRRVQDLLASRSWRITAPLRAIGRRLTQRRQT